MSWWFDLKYAWRLTWKTPGQSALCVVVVALSLGLALWNFEGSYTMLFKPLPFPDSGRWFSIQTAADATTAPVPEMDAFTYQEIVKRSRTIHHLGAYSAQPAVLSEGQTSDSLRAAAISPGLMAAMRAAPLMGRIFDAADGQPGAAATAILSYATWQGYFAADPGIIGRETRIDGRPTRIIGVMSRDFYAFQDFELWTPLEPGHQAGPAESVAAVCPIVYLDPGQNADGVLNEVKPSLIDVNRRYPALFNPARHATLVPAHRMLTPEGYVQIAAMDGFIAVAVLILGSVNISMIFLVRLLERSRELALRTALGSSRGRLLRQCLSESIFVVLPGLLIGIALAGVGIHWAKSIGEVHTQIQATGRDPNQFAMRSVDVLTAVAAAALIWLFSTLIPAWRVSRQDAAPGLAGTGKGVGGIGKARGASVLVGFEVLISCLLLVICANVVFAVKDEVSKPTGIDATDIMITTQSTELGARYADPNARLQYWDDLTAAIESRLPGAGVVFATAVPTDPTLVPASIEHREGGADRGALKLPTVAVSGDYFEMLGLRLRSGRLFDSNDAGGSLGVALVDDNLVKRYWPDAPAVGQRIRLDPKSGGWLTIVGVVSSVSGPYSSTFGVVYRPLRQAAPPAFDLLVKLPTAAVPQNRALLRAAAYGVDRDIPLHNLQMLDDYFKADSVDAVALIPVFSVIGGITLVLAATGVYGLISRSMARRTQEAGIRRALGGTQRQVLAVFLRQAASYLAIGGVGGGLGVVITNLLSSAIPNILILVAPVTVGVFLFMALIILAASYLPARRAVALEPGDALRYD